jgi:hypothetical protein
MKRVQHWVAWLLFCVPLEAPFWLLEQLDRRAIRKRPRHSPRS